MVAICNVVRYRIPVIQDLSAGADGGFMALFPFHQIALRPDAVRNIWRDGELGQVVVPNHVAGGDLRKKHSPIFLAVFPNTREASRLARLHQRLQPRNLFWWPDLMN